MSCAYLADHLDTKTQFELFEKTAIRLRSHWPLHVQGDAGHPSQQGGGQEKELL
jgi:hypothetical protein